MLGVVMRQHSFWGEVGAKQEDVGNPVGLGHKSAEPVIRDIIREPRRAVSGQWTYSVSLGAEEGSEAGGGGGVDVNERRRNCALLESRSRS